MNRPLGLTIIGWLALLGGVLQVLGSLGLVGIGSFAIFIGSTGALETAMLLGYSFPEWTGVALIALGALGVVLGVGILMLRPWSWTMGIVLYALNLLAAVGVLLASGLGATMVFVALLSALMLGYLFTDTARDALGHPAGGGITPHSPQAV